MDIIKRLEAYRLENKISQQALAAKLDISFSTVNRWLNGVVEVYPIDRNGIERKWRFSRNSIEGIKKEILCRRLKDELVIVRAKTNYRWKTVWDDGRYNANVYGTQLLNSIIKTTFPFPKSLYAVEDCIKAVMHNKDNALILDFFAGSGTTGHAVLNLNKNDNGTRRFILCTNNENQIAENVCYPRIKNISIGYKDSKGEKVNGLGGNLKYFRTDFVDAEPTDKNKKRLTLAATEMLCLKEDAFEQVANNKKGFNAILDSIQGLRKRERCFNDAV